MSCEKYYELIVGYMDKMLTHEEEKVLLSHVEACDVCKEHFALFTEIFEAAEEIDLTSVGLTEALAGFEEKVIAKINETVEYQPFIVPLPMYDELEIEKELNAVQREGLLETISCWVFGAFVALALLGYVAVLNEVAILKLLSENTYLSSSLSFVPEMLTDLSAVYANVSTFFTHFFGELSGFADSSKYLILLVFVVLVAVQYFIYYRKGSTAEVENFG